MNRVVFPIRISTPRGVSSFDAREVYFTFPDGGFRYDCGACGAKCCRGYGYSVNHGRELDAQLTQRRHLKLFLDLPPDPSVGYYVGNCPPACYFLNDKGRCNIHEQEGYDAKPETCRLFPFNDFRRVGRYLVVGPHTALCPLEVCPDGVVSSLSSHEALSRVMVGHEITSQAPECRLLNVSPDDVIQLERTIRDTVVSRWATDYAACVTDQLSAFDSSPLSNARPRKERAHRQAEVQNFVRCCSDVLELSQEQLCEPDADLVRTMNIVTPMLRSHLLFPVPSPEKQEEIQRVDIARVPFMLLGLFALARCARLAGMDAITYQTLWQLFQRYQSLLRTLAVIDQPMAWDKSAQIRFPLTGDPKHRKLFLRIARALLPENQQKDRVILGELLCRHAPPDGVERIVFLKQIAGVLANRLVRVDVLHKSEMHASLRHRARSHVQKWMINNVSERLLESTYDRLFTSDHRNPSKKSH